MAKPKDPIETLIVFFSKSIATFQVSTYKILWGVPVEKSAASFSATIKTTPKEKKSNFLQSGLFNILDTINGLDICNVLSFVTTIINSKPPKRSASPDPVEKALYAVQDIAKEVQDTIDKYLALPTTLVRSYAGVQPQAITQKQAIQDFGAPAPGETQISGTRLLAFNTYNLLQNLKDLLETISPNNPNSIFTGEDATLLSQVPGLGGSLNYVDNFVGYINQYTDYRNINNEDLQKLLKKINDIRSVCVTIQTLNFKSALALLGNFLGSDVRAEIQRLSEVLDPTKILPTIKQIANQVNSFIQIAQKIYNVIRQLQFLIKLALLLVKILKFIGTFFLSLPLPNLFTTHGITASLEKARQSAENKNNQVIKRLEQINSLLAVILSFVRYLLTNATELLLRLKVLIAKLEGCESTKDSAVLQDLRDSYSNLKRIQEQLATYILIHDGKTSPDTALFGKYSIRVVEEELTDKSIKNKRRRGIAVDPDGAIVAQSDLTFATNTAIIIEEVKVKLLSSNLVSSQFNLLDASDLAVIATSVNYLENDTVMSEDFNFDSLLKESKDLPDGADETQGLGLNAFINNLSGGRRLRKRVRTALDASSTTFKNQVSQEKVNGENLLKTDNIASSVGTGSNGTLTPAQRVSYIKQLREGPIAAKIAESKLKEDEDAGGIGRKANPLTGI